MFVTIDGAISSFMGFVSFVSVDAWLGGVSIAPPNLNPIVTESPDEGGLGVNSGTICTKAPLHLLF